MKEKIKKNLLEDDSDVVKLRSKRFAIMKEDVKERDKANKKKKSGK